MLIFLIGYRGTGKTTVAALLARRLGWPWVDADALLEQRAGCTIPEIFAKESEAGFRARESALLTELCTLDSHVIATGARVVLDPKTRELLKRTGRVIWLTADADTIHRRLMHDTTSQARRPALTTGGLTEIVDLLAVRAPLYRGWANLTIHTREQGPGDIATQVLDWLAKMNEHLQRVLD